MDYGYFGFNIGPLSNADSIERVVASAEQLGYESIWTAEHVILILHVPRLIAQERNPR